MRGGAGDGSSMVTVPASASLNVSVFLEKSIGCARDVSRYLDTRVRFRNPIIRRQLYHRRHAGNDDVIVIE